MQGTQFNIDSMQRTTDDVSQCTPSVECGDYRNEAAAVVDIYAIDMRLGAMGLCTGDIIQPGPSDEDSYWRAYSPKPQAVFEFTGLYTPTQISKDL